MTTNFNVATESDLDTAIRTIDAATTAGTYTITFTANIAEGTLTVPTVPAGTTMAPDLAAFDLHTGVVVSIIGQSHTLDGANAYRGFFDYSGSVSISDLTIAHTVATGGAGGSAGNFAGGGGAGLGGGLFVGATGTVTLSNVAFTGNKAIGGKGGAGAGGGPSANSGGYAGGGGLGGAGGAIPGDYAAGGGGGIGNDAVGGSSGTGGTTAYNKSGAGIVVGAASGASGGSSTTSGTGGINGGGGGYGTTATNTTPFAGGAGGGGGIGGTAGVTGSGASNGVGGTGGFGGGGGGGYTKGGAGGFGGGGGGGFSAAGTGGWGGGGGGGGGAAGLGGGAGGGAVGQFKGGSGGGGLGAGGDIFVYQGGSVILQSGTLSGGSVTGGAAGAVSNGASAGAAGSAVGSGIYLYGTADVLTLSPGSGQSVVINDLITDQTGSFLGSGKGSLQIVGAGTVKLAVSNTYSGNTTINAGGTLELGTSASAGGGTITFGSTLGTLKLDASVTPTNTVASLLIGDVIDAAGFAGGTATFNTSTGNLTIAKGGLTSIVLKLDRTTYNAAGFTATTDSSTTGLAVTFTACYVRGTRIATPRGPVAVEMLRRGDLVDTHGGTPKPVKWIGRREYDRPAVAANKQVRPVRVRAHALGPHQPVRDLLVSPMHALMIARPADGPVLVPAGALVNGHSILREPACDVAYFHIELDAHDLVIAEGCAAETFVDCDSRAMFQNAAEYAALFPDEVTTTPAFCLPRVEDGPIVEAARQRLAARAGALRAACAPGALLGHVERIVDGMIEGWALNEADPLQPVMLELHGEASPPIRILANRYRLDLDRAGLGEGNGGFRVALPPGLRGVRVVRAGDGVSLPGPHGG